MYSIICILNLIQFKHEKTDGLLGLTAFEN